MARIAALRVRLVWILALGALAACSEQPSPEPVADGAAPPSGMTVFQGARVIVGDGTVIEGATFTVGPDNRFGLVGTPATIQLPRGATAIVDLSGLTVMPAIF